MEFVDEFGQVGKIGGLGRKVGQQFQAFGNLRAVVIDARGQAEQAKGFAAGIGAVEAPVVFLLPVQPVIFATVK